LKFQAKASADFTPVPAGSHIAICNAVVDVGLQSGSGLYPDPKHQVYIRFELPTERLKFKRDDKEVEGPMVIGKFFTASMSKKSNLRKFIEGWFAKQFTSDEKASAFDISDLIGKRCLLTVTHTERGEKTYANINASGPIPKGMKSDYKPENPLIVFDLNEPDEEMFGRLPTWLCEKINKRMDEKKATTTETVASDDFVDDNLDDVAF